MLFQQINKFLKINIIAKMQEKVTINNIKMYNHSLLLVQLGLCLLSTLLISRKDSSQCRCEYYNIALPTTLLLIVINALVILYVRYKHSQSRTQYLALISVNVVAIGTIGLLALGQSSSNDCAQDKALEEVASLLAFKTLILIVIDACFSFEWNHLYIRYPGNVTWVMLLLFGQVSTLSIKVLLAAGIIHLIIFVGNLAISINVCRNKNLTSLTKKINFIWWLSSLITLFIIEILVLFINKTGNQSSSNYYYQMVVAQNLSSMFLAVNFINILFSTFFFVTIKYRDGDQVKDVRFRDGLENSQNLANNLIAGIFETQ